MIQKDKISTFLLPAGDKVGQKSDYFIKCYQGLTSYIFIFEH